MTKLTPKLNPTTVPLQSYSNLSSQICHGSSQTETLPGTLAMPVAWIPAGYSEPSTEMLQKPSSLSKLHQIPQAESPHRNGNESSKGKQLTSISSSHCSTMLSLMRREQVTWETRRSLLGLLNQRRRSQQQQSGPPLGEGLQRPSPLPFPTDTRSFSNMETTSSWNSLQKSHLPITNFSYTTLPSKMESQRVNKPYSSTSSSSAGSTQPLSYRMGLRLEEQNVNANMERNLDLRKATNQRSATISMPEPAKTLQPTANTDISVKPVENQTMEKRTAQMEASEIHGLHPKYLRHNLWDEGLSLSPATAEWSEHAAPLPRLSQNSPTMVPGKLSQSILNYSKSKLLSMSMSLSLY